MKSKIVLALLSALVSFSALADTKISALPAGTTLGGTEPIPMVQSATTVATTPAAILTYLNANSRAFSGDCTTPGGSGVLTCTKTNGVTFAPIATSGSASDLTAGTVAAARGGAGAVNGALKANGSGAVSQAACADLSNAAASCSTDATNANNISAGTLSAGRVPAQTGDTVSSAGSTATTTQLLHPTDNTYTANHTVTATEEIVTCNSSGALTMTLPAATGTNKHYWFKNINTGTCTIARAGSDTIDNATSVALSTQYNTSELIDRAAGVWDRLAQPVLGGDSSGTPSNTTNKGLNGVALAGLGSGLLYNTTGTGVPSSVTAGAGLALSSSSLALTTVINAQGGTSYALGSTDNAQLVTFSNASPVAVSIVAATTTGFTAGYSVAVQNKGAGTVTITPTTSTINGTASLALVTNQGCVITSDGTNYQIEECTAAITSLPSLTTVGTIAAGTWQGTAVGAPYGGSGVASPTAHNVAIAEGASNYSFVAGGTNCVLAWSVSSSDPTCNGSPFLVNIRPTTSYRFTANNTIESSTNPTVTACTSPTVTGTSGTWQFVINVGTSCATGTLTITFPVVSGTTGWGCNIQDVTSNSSLVLGQSAITSTSVSVFTAYSRTTGVAANFNSSDQLIANCGAN